MGTVKIVTFVPLEYADKVREALGQAGAGIIGEYTYCSYSVVGKGRFIPSQNSKPYIGKSGKHEVVDEERIEVICPRDKAKQVIAAMKEAHPYEKVAIDIYPLIEEEAL